MSDLFKIVAVDTSVKFGEVVHTYTCKVVEFLTIAGFLISVGRITDESRAQKLQAALKPYEKVLKPALKVLNRLQRQDAMQGPKDRVRKALNKAKGDWRSEPVREAVKTAEDRSDFIIGGGSLKSAIPQKQAKELANAAAETVGADTVQAMLDKLAKEGLTEDQRKAFGL